MARTWNLFLPQRAEQGLRKTAKARNNYQTSKTEAGADRRSVLSSVLISLQQNLLSFSLTTVIEEVTQWRRDGVTLFDRQLQMAQARASPGQWLEGGITLRLKPLLWYGK